ncbi:hypothetical protein [Variovorax sp. J31P207]|uniref:hypothetical protein n=1 Tax=Variovorax sp. J31P207 TaxID=3053510 RepID=UPI00257873E2|nr:hypothetical protein [Variovorax sp. J31P207]MDM0072576.1 hypothetical protein [Variovorax sp. J31P207]
MDMAIGAPAARRKASDCVPTLPNSRIGEWLPHHWISADYSLSSWEGQVQTEHPAILSLLIVPLDGEEHARAEHEDLERNEDYRDPIHHFEYFQAIT